jgi:hypothetical protein
MFELALVQTCLASEIVVYRALDNVLYIYAWRTVLHVDDQSDRLLQRVFRRPAHDEFFQIVIQVFLVKQGRVHRVKKLLQVLQIDLDGVLLLLARQRRRSDFGMLMFPLLSIELSPFDKFADGRRDHGAGLPSHFQSVTEKDHRWNCGDTIMAPEAWHFLGIYFCHEQLTRRFVSDFAHFRRHHFAWTAPWRPEID